MTLRSASLYIVLSAILGCATASSSTNELPAREEVSRPQATPDVLRGEKMLVDGRVSEAMSVFEQAIEDDPEDARAWLDLGIAREASDDPRGAEEAYRRATEIDPRFAEGYNNLGVLLRERGELARATPILERAVDLDPDLAAARFNLGLAYEDQGRFDEAEREYLATIRRLAGDPIPRINLGMMYLEAGRPDDAASQFRAARPAVRGDVLLSIAVGEGLRRVGSPNEAVAVLSEALDGAGSRPPTSLLAELALAHYAARDLDSAEHMMKRAIEQDELDPALQYAYGSILAAQGQLGQARAHLRRAVKLDPDGPYAARARGRLESLR